MTLSMSDQQLEVYRATRRRRAADDAERRRARAEAGLRLAREAAALLRGRYGVSEVYLFGSLAEGDAFGIAVSPGDYRTAAARIRQALPRTGRRFDPGR